VTAIGLRCAVGGGGGRKCGERRRRELYIRRRGVWGYGSGGFPRRRLELGSDQVSPPPHPHGATGQQGGDGGWRDVGWRDGWFRAGWCQSRRTPGIRARAKWTQSLAASPAATRRSALWLHTAIGWALIRKLRHRCSSAAAFRSPARRGVSTHGGTSARERYYWGRVDFRRLHTRTGISRSWRVGGWHWAGRPVLLR